MKNEKLIYEEPRLSVFLFEVDLMQEDPSTPGPFSATASIDDIEY